MERSNPRMLEQSNSRGASDEALRIRREEELPVYERLGDVHSRAVTLGQIADILFRRGELDEALRIRREEQLPVFERLGDVRSRAVAMGKIADILASRGELDEARALQDERVQMYRQHDDTDGIASALWGLAQLDLGEKKVEDAIPRLSESYDILCRLGRADGVAVVGMCYGQLLAAADKPDEALAVLRRSVEMFRKLGREADAQKAEKIIAKHGSD
jgi:tetratricopeptide (TPR) repeat protein